MAAVTPPSWISENLISEQCSPWAGDIFNHGTKFGAKMLIDAEIMAQNRNPRWHAVRHLGFVISSYMTTHKVFS